MSPLGDSSPSVSRLKVLQITASSAIGGGPEHVWQLLRHLPPDIKSYVAAPCKPPYWTRFQEAVGEDCCLSIPQRRWSFHAMWRLLLWARQQGIELIHCHGKGAGLYGRLLALLSGIPCVHTFHGVHQPQNPLLRLVYLTLERQLSRWTSACIAVSESEASVVRELHFGCKRLTVVPNGVEVAQALPRAVMQNPFTLLHVTRFDAAKNSQALIFLALAMKAQGVLERCRFVIIGDGEERPMMERQLASAGLSTFFVFVGPTDNVRALLRGAGCYISTSLGEGLPLAVLEAQAEGVPAVVSAVRGNTDAIVHNVTGFVFPLGNMNLAATQIRRLMDDVALRERMGLEAHRRVQDRHDVRAMARAIADVYRALPAR